MNDYSDYIPMIHVANYVLDEFQNNNNFDDEEQKILDSYLNYYKNEIKVVKEALPRLDLSDLDYNVKVKYIIKLLYELKGKQKDINEERHLK